MYKKVVVRPWAPPELPGKRARLTAQTKKRHADLAHGTLEALDRMAKRERETERVLSSYVSRMAFKAQRFPRGIVF